MGKKQLFTWCLLVLLSPVVTVSGSDIEDQQARPFGGQDLHLTGTNLISYQFSTGEHTLVFTDKLSMSIGANHFSSDSAVVWLESVITEFRARTRIDYNAKVYLQGNVSTEKAKRALTTDLNQTVIEKGSSVFLWFTVSGQVFVTADKREIADLRGTELYKKALAISQSIKTEPEFVVQPGAQIPKWPLWKAPPEKPRKKLITTKPSKPAKPVRPGFIEQAVARQEKARRPEEKKPTFVYPVNIAPAGATAPKMESDDQRGIVTVIGRFYLWQKQDEEGGLLELQADSAVMFLADSGQRTADSKKLYATRYTLSAIYMSGNVLITEGQRTIRADEVYYDFQRKKALAVNAVMRNFDAKRGIPIYVRAAKLHQIAENKFAAENITLTSSEFYLPQISLNASSVIITDTTTIDTQLKQLSDSSYDAEMHDIRLKAGDKTIFYWPFIRGNLHRPDVPLKSMHAGYDSIWGMSVETQWHLSRLLGLREPEGVDSTLAMDYFSKRGLGTGAEIDYAKEDYYGRLSGYLIRDTGKDRLGRHSSRRHLDPPRALRGRFSWLHRQFLPYKWQLTTGIDYASDERFTEAYYRNEFNVAGRQETYLHLKHIKDNEGISILTKGRINDFADELEELPSIEYHLTGQSIFDDRLTLYSDTQVSRLRQRIGNEHSTLIDEKIFSFVSHRTELDMPVQTDSVKIVPFVAGTFGYDDRSGFRRTLVDGSSTGSFGDDKVWIAEAGVRIFPQPYWKVYPDVKSRLWDLNQLRHIIKPQVTAAAYEQSDLVVKQRDTLNLGISQRLQTRRRYSLPADNQQNRQTHQSDYRTVDWMRLDTDFTWVKDSDKAHSSGPDRFIWAKPIVPMRVLSAPEIFSGDLINSLHRFEMFGPRRNYFSADYIWRVSDTSAILSDMNFDMQSSVVQQFNIGLSRLCWPNLQFYIGSRYLRRIEVLDEKGTNAFTFASTYRLDRRYTLVFAQQFDFDYGANVRSDITLIRRYHRMFCGFTYSADESLDRQAIVFSIWPQGVPEMAMGQRRYMGIGGSAGY